MSKFCLLLKWVYFYSFSVSLPVLGVSVLSAQDDDFGVDRFRVQLNEPLTMKSGVLKLRVEYVRGRPYKPIPKVNKSNFLGFKIINSIEISLHLYLFHVLI